MSFTWEGGLRPGRNSQISDYQLRMLVRWHRPGAQRGANEAFDHNRHYHAKGHFPRHDAGPPRLEPKRGAGQGQHRPFPIPALPRREVAEALCRALARNCFRFFRGRYCHAQQACTFEKSHSKAKALPGYLSDIMTLSATLPLTNLLRRISLKTIIDKRLKTIPSMVIGYVGVAFAGYVGVAQDVFRPANVTIQNEAFESR